LVRTLAPEPSFIQGSRFLPSELWVSPWTPPLSTHPSPITVETLAETVYESAARQSGDRLLIAGQDVGSLVMALEEAISKCISLGDFTKLLLPNRTFQM